MSTFLTNLFTINGVIDTSKDVMTNINTIASAASSWVTFDIHEGKWSVVVNEPVVPTTVAQRTANVVTLNGSVSTQTFVKKLGQGSLALNTGYLSMPSSSSFAFSTDDLAIELWFYKTANNTTWLIDHRNTQVTSAPALRLQNNNLYFYHLGADRITAVNAVASLNTWYHIALTRKNGTTQIYVNGRVVGNSYYNASNWGVACPLTIGAAYDGTSQATACYIDEVRISRGTARYYGEFDTQKQAFVNDSNTVLLMHLDTIVEDENWNWDYGQTAVYNDSNIIGSINVSSTGVNELYNRVQLQFPHKDLGDRVDTITFEIPPEQRHPYEVDNTLNFEFDCINDPVLAEYLAMIALKQSRVDKVIRFRTDFTSIGLKAGDLITVTNDAYSFREKVFRVLNVAEDDGDDGSLVLSVTAFEYDLNVYTNTGLIRTERTGENGIVAECVNDTIAASEEAAAGASLEKLLLPLAATSLFNWMFPKIGKSLFEALNSPSTTITVSATDVCEGNSVIVTTGVCCSTCQNLSGVEIDYEITGVSASDIGVPLTGKITCNSSGVGTLTIPILVDGIEGDETLTFKATSAGKTTTKTVTIHDGSSYSVVPANASITEGGSTTVTITTTGIPNGTSKNYVISGTGVDQLSGTPTNGSVTINNGTASFTVSTKDIDKLGNTNLSIVFDPGTFYCSKADGAITIVGTGVPPDPPDPTYNCEFVTIPAFWCGTWNSSGQMVGITPVGTITVLRAIAGKPSATVPATATVADGAITIASTVDIDMSSGKGGRMAKIITSFNAPQTGVKLVTGTTIDVIGI